MWCNMIFSSEYLGCPFKLIRLLSKRLVEWASYDKMFGIDLWIFKNYQ